MASLKIMVATMMLEHNIDRVVYGDIITIAAKDPEDEKFEVEVIASFKTSDLRDLALRSFVSEIIRNQEIYPNHKVRNKKK